MATLTQVGAQTLTVSTTSVGLTIPSGIYPSHALIQVTTANVRWRADETDPTSTAGIIVTAGSNIEWLDPLINYEGLIRNVEFIRDDAVDAVLEIAYFSA